MESLIQDFFDCLKQIDNNPTENFPFSFDRLNYYVFIDCVWGNGFKIDACKSGIYRKRRNESLLLPLCQMKPRAEDIQCYYKGDECECSKIVNN